MAFTIPNLADAAFPAQSEVDARDLEIVSASFAGVGVISGCAVTPQGSPDMTVAVAAGGVIVGTTYAAVTGGNVTITAANGSNPRHDLIVVDNTGAKSAVAGTAAASPRFPAIPANSVVLAAVYVPAADTAINANQITDKRMVITNPDLVDKQLFTSNGTWTKPAWAPLFPNAKTRIILIAGGSGGGGGARRASATASSGGTGAGGAGLVDLEVFTSEMASTGTVTVGAAGAGGAAASGDNANGSAGTAGGNTQLASAFADGRTPRAGFGTVGAGGATSAAGAGGGGNGTVQGGSSGAANLGTGTGGGGSTVHSMGVTGGGAGGGIDATPTARSGGPGGAASGNTIGQQTGGAPGVSAAAGATGWGNAILDIATGVGGGGGGSSISGAAGSGAAGRDYGGGGGGGGASLNGSAAGAGGAGGAGVALIVTWLS